MVKILIIIVLILVFLYLFAIKPRLFFRPDKSQLTGVLYAHRGLHDNQTDAPENSLRAFEKAVEKGFGIELDVQLSKDRIPVVFHDYTLDRICGQKGKVCDYTLEELKQFKLCNSEQTIPSFSEVLQLVRGRVPLIIEYKVEYTDVSVCKLSNELLMNYNGEYCIESFNPLALMWYRIHCSHIVRGQLSEEFYKNKELRHPIHYILAGLLFNFATCPDFVAYNHRHKHNLSRVLTHVLYRCTQAAWTIRSQTELDSNQKSFDTFIFDSFLPDGESIENARKRAEGVRL